MDNSMNDDSYNYEWERGWNCFILGGAVPEYASDAFVEGWEEAERYYKPIWVEQRKTQNT